MPSFRCNVDRGAITTGCRHGLVRSGVGSSKGLPVNPNPGFIQGEGVIAPSLHIVTVSHKNTVESSIPKRKAGFIPVLDGDVYNCDP